MDKIVFIDRDGVINQFPGHGSYVTTVKDFRFIPGSRRAIAKLSQAGYKIFIISNQAGVGRGIFSKDTLYRITAKMINGINKSDGHINGVYYCTHKPDDGCDCRKPGIGNIKRVARQLRMPLSKIKGHYFIGDTEKDVQTAKKAGLKSILVLSGHDGHKDIKKWQVQPDVIVHNLKRAIEVIL